MSAALIKSIPDWNRIPYTLTANVMLGVASLTLGLIGGALADMALLVPHLVMHEYSLTFLFTAIIAAVVAILTTQLPGPQLRTLFTRAFVRESVGFATVRLSIALNRLNLNPTLEFYLRTEASAPGRGLSDLLEDAAEFEVILAIRDEVLDAVHAGDHRLAWESIQRVIREIQRPDAGSVVYAGSSLSWVSPLLESATSAVPSPELAPVAVIASLYLVQHVLDATTA